MKNHTEYLVYPVLRRSPDGWVETTFDQTPIMSCYLLCIVIGDFVELYSGNDNGYEVGSIYVYIL